MAGLKLSLKMEFRRWASNLLTALFLAAATVFLLLYPGFIQRAEAELDAAYSAIDVSGWFTSAVGYEDPEIPLAFYDVLEDSGFIQNANAVSYVSMAPLSSAVENLRNTDQNFAALTLAEQYAKIKTKPIINLALSTGDRLYGLNHADADARFSHLLDTVEWLDGYSADMFAGSEAVCVYPVDAGVALGDEVELIVRRANPRDIWSDVKREYMTFKVVGLHGMRANASPHYVYCPLSAMREAFSDPSWCFSLRSFSFTLKDSRTLNGFKHFLVELGLHENEAVRVSIDDRILTGTISPLQKNAALLRGLHPFFYGIVALMGFFLCFLTTRRRGREYGIMRMLGESGRSVAVKSVVEQVLLCCFGLLLGITTMLLIPGKQSDWMNPAAVALIMGCYCLGAFFAMLFTVRVNITSLLQGKE